jgi:putative addiction module killer protein
MNTIIQTDTFAGWLKSLKDQTARARIARRIEKMAEGSLGDVRPARDGVHEARIDYGPGYRLYFVSTGKTIIVLLCGGDKRTQDKDIRAAIKLAKELED